MFKSKKMLQMMNNFNQLKIFKSLKILYLSSMKAMLKALEISNQLKFLKNHQNNN